MKRVIGFAALLLGGIGLAACLAGLIAIWAMRPSVLRSSAEVLDAADGGLKIVHEKATRADELVKTIREVVDPVTSKILKLPDKADRTPEDEKELNRIEEALSERLGQVDTIAETAETAAAFLSKTSRLTSAFRLTSRASVGQSEAADSQNTSDTLARLAKKLKELRANLAKFREDKEAQREVIDAAIRLARDVDEDLKLIDATLQRVRQKAVEWGTEVAELRTSVPTWTDWAAVIGSALLVWMGLGQFALSRWGWGRLRAERSG